MNVLEWFIIILKAMKKVNMDYLQPSSYYELKDIIILEDWKR